MRRAVAMLAAVAVGIGVAALLDLTTVDENIVYTTCVATLLGFGLYASATGIHVDRRRLPTVLLAVTVGVVAKAALIFGVMYWVFGRPEYLVLGIAVAQIDPLSVAAVRMKSRMSDSAKSLLAAWASFDDPITVLLTVYVTAYALDASPGLLSSFGLSLLWNVVLAAIVFAAWRLWPRGELPRTARVAVWIVAIFGLGAVAFIAVGFSLYLALAVIGLFLRPRGDVVDRAAEYAVLPLATFAVGLVLISGVAIVPGLVLGAAAYLGQVVIALILTLPKMWHGDRVRLALAQQNGMTAIVLALTLEPTFPGTVAIVAPAIVTVNLLHTFCNAIWDHFWPPAAFIPAPQAGQAHPTPAG